MELKEKDMTIYLIIDYDTGRVRARKTKPEEEEIKATEIPIVQNITFKVPKNNFHEIEQEIVVPEEKVNKIVMDHF